MSNRGPEDKIGNTFPRYESKYSMHQEFGPDVSDLDIDRAMAETLTRFAVATLPTPEESAKARIWRTKNGREIDYEFMPLDHIKNILACFDRGKLGWFRAHEPGLREELKNR